MIEHGKCACLPRRSFLKLSAGTVQAMGELFSGLTLLRPAIQGRWVHKAHMDCHTYVGELLMTDRVVQRDWSVSHYELVWARDPKIIRQSCENRVHNLLHAALIAA